jgi:hypothetical protein
MIASRFGAGVFGYFLPMLDGLEGSPRARFMRRMDSCETL